jgi:hypothetical protein
MHANREAIRQQLAGLSLAELTKESVAALLNEHESKDSRGRTAPGATQYVGYIRTEWIRRSLTDAQWQCECLEAGRAELKRRRRQMNQLPPRTP